MKIKRHAYIFYISCIIVSIFSTCRYFHPKEEEKATVVATVDNENLTIEYIANLIPSSLTPEDSISFVEKFVDDWIKKQLMIKEAEEKIDFNKAQIKKKVLDYQYALMVHEFEQSYIELNLNKKVNEREIIQYYEENSDNFVLRETLVKCIYFKIPKKNIWDITF